MFCVLRDNEQVLSLGVSPDRIVFANPCKRPTDLACLKKAGIPHTTFDSVAEVAKLKGGCPNVGALLRLRADDPTARLAFGVKYGAMPNEVPALLAACAENGVRLAGVSFHVGSGAGDAMAFRAALEQAKRVRQLQLELDPSALVRPWLLDVGGGFGGGFRPDTGGAFCAAGSSFDPQAPNQVCEVINAALDDLFPAKDFPGGLQVISEPGRYFAECASHLVTHVFGKRERLPGGGCSSSLYQDCAEPKAHEKVDHHGPELPPPPSTVEPEYNSSAGYNSSSSFDNSSSNSSSCEEEPDEEAKEELAQARAVLQPIPRVRPQRLATCVTAHFAGTDVDYAAGGRPATTAFVVPRASARTPPAAAAVAAVAPTTAATAAGAGAAGDASHPASAGATAAAAAGAASNGRGASAGAKNPPAHPPVARGRRRPARLNQRFAAHFAAQPWPPPGPLPGVPMRTAPTFVHDSADHAATSAASTTTTTTSVKTTATPAATDLNSKAAVDSADRGGEVHYYIGDGLYGAFNAVLYDGWLPKAVPFRVDASTGNAAPCTAPGPPGTTATVFGPTCDSLDMVFCALPNCPKLDVGDWLLFPNCGAYTQAGATDFNGIPSTFVAGVRNYYVRGAGHASCAADDALPVLFSPEAPVSVSKNF